MTDTIRLALAVALLLASASARAQSEPAATGESYRWQIATTDAVLISTATLGFSIEGPHGSASYVPSHTMIAVGGVGYFLGAPIVHLAHKQYARAGASLALRVGLPILGAVIGNRAASCSGSHDDWCGLDQAADGFWAGAVAAAVLDSLVITPGPTPAAEPARIPTAAQPERAPTAARAPEGVHLAPRLVAAPNLAMIGLGGQF